MDTMQIINEALLALPPDIRNDFLGIAWEKLQTLTGTEEEKVKAVRNHCLYQLKKESRGGQPLPLLFDLPDYRDDPAEQAVVNEYMEGLDPVDRAIIAMILAGQSHRAIAQDLGTSASTIRRRLARLRGGWQC